MNGAAERLVDIVAAKARAGEEVEVFRLFGQLTMEVVGSTAFGYSLPCQGVCCVLKKRRGDAAAACAPPQAAESCISAEYLLNLNGLLPCFRTELLALKAGAKPISTDLSGIVFEAGDDAATTLQKAAAVDYATLGGQRGPACTLQTLDCFGKSLWSSSIRSSFCRSSRDIWVPTFAAGGHGSPYLALVVLFPNAAPLIRRLAMLFPDAKLRKWIQVSARGLPSFLQRPCHINRWRKRHRNRTHRPRLTFMLHRVDVDVHGNLVAGTAADAGALLSHHR